MRLSHQKNATKDEPSCTIQKTLITIHLRKSSIVEFHTRFALLLRKICLLLRNVCIGMFFSSIKFRLFNFLIYHSKCIVALSLNLKKSFHL